MLKDRVSSARSLLDLYNLDAILFLYRPNIRYLSGFTGSDGALLIGKQFTSFLTDSRYTSQAATEVVGPSIHEYRSKLEGIRDCLHGTDTVRVGLEAEQVSLGLYNSLCEHLPGLEFVPLTKELDGLRIIKDVDELRMLDEVAALASNALLQVLQQIRPGVSEWDVALWLEMAMRQAGAEGVAFDFIVASGERGALPHGKASRKLIAEGELVTIDFGAVLSGYHSDETVTVAVGEANERQREIYGIVKDAHDRAIAEVRPGLTFRELDAIARDHISGRGLGGYFGHGLGHGVGLEIHEKPTVSPRGEGMIESGMVFTVEPGVYIPGWGGVRIEDTIAVTDQGCRLVTKATKELLVI